MQQQERRNLSTMNLAAFSERLASKRGTLGIRAAAREAGVSPATLSRVENGHLPDLETFERLCRWLAEDPNRFLDSPATKVVGTVQFRKQKTVLPATAEALGELFMRVHQAFGPATEDADAP
jgi:transcriptional regulator with XRE-family HTH domain